LIATFQRHAATTKCVVVDEENENDVDVDDKVSIE
jgi:hypothetical protein